MFVRARLDIVPRVRRDLAERKFAFVESELNEERASALSRAVRKVETSHQRCAQLGAQLDESGDTEVLDDYRQARAAFEQCRWELCVHREAIGLNNHRWIDGIFPMPPRR
ncbi:MAG: hypothetical protein JWN99_1230 [Ilumatobacteraceae bacterium]|nr:hypothetical protein [Ilumatobacteraceae bacterium]